jgi:hypothetical protein
MIVALVLLSAFLHALWNALLRLEADKDRALMAVVVAALFAAEVAGVRWELGAAPFASLVGVGFTLLAGMMEASYFATLAKAMALGRLGVVYTISRGGAVLAVWPLSIALFSEAATLPALAGSAVVVGGLALSGLGGSRSGGAGPARRGGLGGGVRDVDRGVSPGVQGCPARGGEPVGVLRAVSRGVGGEVDADGSPARQREQLATAPPGRRHNLADQVAAADPAHEVSGALGAADLQVIAAAEATYPNGRNRAKNYARSPR